MRALRPTRWNFGEAAHVEQRAGQHLKFRNHALLADGAVPALECAALQNDGEAAHQPVSFLVRDHALIAQLALLTNPADGWNDDIEVHVPIGPALAGVAASCVNTPRMVVFHQTAKFPQNVITARPAS